MTPRSEQMMGDVSSILVKAGISDDYPRYMKSMNFPTHLNQIEIVRLSGEAAAFGTWAFIAYDRMRIAATGKPILLDIGDWNEGYIAMIVHCVSTSAEATWQLKRAIERRIGDAEAICWLRPTRNGRRGRLTIIGTNQAEGSSNG